MLRKHLPKIDYFIYSSEQLRSLRNGCHAMDTCKSKHLHSPKIAHSLHALLHNRKTVRDSIPPMISLKSCDVVRQRFFSEVDPTLAFIRHAINLKRLVQRGIEKFLYREVIPSS